MTTELIGKTVGEYRLAEVIGEGKLATVFRAYQASLERWVAVKMLHRQEQETLRRFEQEAQAIAGLRHRNILIVYGYGKADDWPYIAMEYVEAGTLREFLGGEPLNWMKVVDLLIPIAEALGYAHQRGSLHRDIKPSNVLMAQEDWPLLADFGLVKFPSKGERITQSNFSLGTPTYIAPEQIQNTTDVGPSVDIYSLGVMAYEMLAGRPPFTYRNVNKMLMAHLSEPVPPLLRFCPDCPDSLERIVYRALLKQPEERYESIEAMVKELRNIMSSSLVRPVFYDAKPPSESEIMTYRKASEEKVEETKPKFEPQAARLFLVEQKASIPLPTQEEIIVGRSHRDILADVDLSPYDARDMGVSRHHAKLLHRDDAWYIEDMHSLNGTFVNEVRVMPASPAPLQDGDIVRCSHLSFVFLLA